MKSLLLVGSPRSMTTLIWEVCYQSLPELQPFPCDSWKGEILDRDCCACWTFEHCARSAAARDRAMQLLSAYQEGYVLKDVVQPFLLGTFVRCYPDQLNVLYLHRAAEDVRLCQHRVGWTLFPPPTLYETAYAACPRVEYSDLVQDSSYLWQALAAFGYDVQPREYRTPAFLEKLALTEETLADYRARIYDTQAETTAAAQHA